ncbi:MAG TPA: hypothetical protein VFQ26_09485, partial [Nitrospiraceae bacterium]|nr:hypothetical protein [Nitrospiraceae bacterium]
ALGEDFCREKLGLTDAQLNESNFNMLKALGFTQEEIAAANDYCCGTMTVEGRHISKASTCRTLIVPIAAAGLVSDISPSMRISA